MDVQTTLAQPLQNGSNKAQNAANITSDFTTFLKMLTTQLQNQDPLNPMDSTDFAVQLATFSGVEQQVQTNDHLSRLNGQFALLGMAQLSAWVGKEARSTADVWFDGGAIPVIPNPAPMADNLVLVVRDSTGTLISREDVPMGSGQYLWLGGNAAGDLLPPGRYSLSLESRIGPEVIRTSPVESYAPIQEARRSGNDILLLLRGGVEISASEVTALRD
ncbi:flagellar hook capping FlgD N-terminal domain-containing protein [Tabrizicola sp. M-4]|uniref:flagellar hook capping FlgD N-terminal domain-containing protein n=1 Tax=Tabrizicola sp. M-4 TaxID=3055847 RepID=UPI003DA81A2A